jgi:hypothetical protein
MWLVSQSALRHLVLVLNPYSKSEFAELGQPRLELLLEPVENGLITRNGLRSQV